MAQLRQDYDQFVEREAVILVVGPEDQSAFLNYWQKNDLPFIGLPDPKHHVADLYDQEFNWLRMGRMPAMFLIDRIGQIRYHHYGDSMRDVVSNQSVLRLLDQINQEQEFENSLYAANT